MLPVLANGLLVFLTLFNIEWHVEFFFEFLEHAVKLQSR